MAVPIFDCVESTDITPKKNHVFPLMMQVTAVSVVSNALFVKGEDIQYKNIQ